MHRVRESLLAELDLVTGGLALGALSHQLALVRSNDLHIESRDGVQSSGDGHEMPVAQTIAIAMPGVHFVGSNDHVGYVGTSAPPRCGNDRNPHAQSAAHTDPPYAATSAETPAATSLSVASVDGSAPSAATSVPPQAATVTTVEPPATVPPVHVAEVAEIPAPPPDYSGPLTTPDGTILGPLGRDARYGVVMDYDVGVAPGQDPIVLDLDGSGFNLRPSTYGVDFDITGDGEGEHIGWTDPRGASTDAFLVRDDRWDGGAAGIQSGLEFSGDQRGDANGFERLRHFDTNQDGVFNASDAAFQEVELWQDINGDGISQADEISTLANHGIIAIELPQQPTTVNGDLTTLFGRFVRAT